jgi:hypothetical protein
MNKFLLALLIAAAGTLLSARLNLLARQNRASAARAGSECRQVVAQAKALTASVAELRAQLDVKRARLDEALAARANQPAPPAAPPSAPSADTRAGTPAQLRRRYGIAWDNSPDYVLVSKEALDRMYLQGISEKGVFTPTACAILGLTPTERETIEAALKSAEAEHAEWAKTAVQRFEPAGDILADYRLPANTNLAARLESEGKALVKETIGPERAKLIEGYAGAWLLGHGNLGATPIRLTVRRHRPGEKTGLWFMYEALPGNSSCGEIVKGSFPELFRGAFPGGWGELAQREGFTLPPGVE